MLNIYFQIIINVFISNDTVTSKYVSRTGHLHVASQSRYLDVEADNYQVYCEIVPSSGLVKVKGLIKSFEFKMGALDRAFNSDRVNLTEFSNFNYEGRIINIGAINFTKPGRYEVEVKGNLHLGNYKRVTLANGILIVEEGGTLRAETSFDMRIEESSVQTINQLMKEKLPSVLSLDADKLGISREVELTLNADFRPRG